MTDAFKVATWRLSIHAVPGRQAGVESWSLWAARAWDALAALGEPRPPRPPRVRPTGLVEVAGPAGSGKTGRLLAWARALSGRGGRVLWLDCDRVLEGWELEAMAPATVVVLRPACPVAAIEVGCRALAAGVADAVALDSLGPLQDCRRPGFDHDLCAWAGWRPGRSAHAANSLGRLWQRAARLARRLEAGIWVANPCDTLFADSRRDGPIFRGRPAGRRTSAIQRDGSDRPREAVKERVRR